MKRLVLSGAIALLFFPILASALVVGLNDDVHFDYPGVANDFHIEGIIYSGGGIAPTVTNIMVFGDPGTGVWVVDQYCLIPIGFNQWKFIAHFKTNGYIKFCQWIHFGIKFNVNAYNVIADLQGWWTLDGAPITSLQAEETYKQVAVTGFDVYGTGEDKMLKITNSTNLPVVVNQLELTVSNEEIPLGDMFSTGLGRPGQQSPKYPYLIWKPVHGLPEMLQPGQSFEIRLIDFGIFMMPGQFLQMRGEQFMEGTKPLGTKGISQTQVTPDWGWFWEQHGE